jgi:hypothetical protein
MVGCRPELSRIFAAVEHPFGTIKARMGAAHFLMKTLPRVATEMALHVLAYTAFGGKAAVTRTSHDVAI